ncbi:MAG: DUF4382 domain-containing protein [Candidatus Omnitrophota bacterium]|nr:DUF4382 domain-containing protein [Candidatus Omnitrophota bacterium]
MIKRRLKAIVIAATTALVFAAYSYAGNADTYKITVQSIQLKSSAGNWVTIASPNREIDIASVNSGAIAASLASDVSVPVGTYVNFKIVVSEIIKFSGSDGVNYTKAGGAVTVTGTAASAASTATWPTAPPTTVVTMTENTESHTAVLAQKGEITATMDMDAGDADNYMEIYRSNDLTTPITVNAGSTVSMFFDFDTQGTINYINLGGLNEIMFFTPPQSGTQFGITVDSVTTTINASDMRNDF